MIETEAKQTADVGVSIVCATAWVARIVSFPVYCKFSIISPPGVANFKRSRGGYWRGGDYKRGNLIHFLTIFNS